MSVNIITPRTHLPHRPPEHPEHSNQRTAPSLQRTHRQFTSTRLHPRRGAAASVKRGTSAYTGARASSTPSRQWLRTRLLTLKLTISTRTFSRQSSSAAWVKRFRVLGDSWELSQPVVGLMVRGSCFASMLRDPSDACEMRWPILTDPLR